MGPDFGRFRLRSHGRLKFTVSPRFVQMMLAGHSALGAAFAALIYIVCLTGMISVEGGAATTMQSVSVPAIAAPFRRAPQSSTAVVRAIAAIEAS
jgi:hypothetical protein